MADEKIVVSKKNPSEEAHGFLESDLPAADLPPVTEPRSTLDIFKRLSVLTKKDPSTLIEKSIAAYEHFTKERDKKAYDKQKLTDQERQALGIVLEDDDTTRWAPPPSKGSSGGR